MFERISALVALLLVLVAASPVGAQARPESGVAWRNKIHATVLDQSAGQPLEFILVLADQTHPTPPDALRSKGERGAWVVQRLRSHAETTQRPLILLLERRRADYRSYWIANLIWVRADLATLEQLARRPEVLRVDANPKVAFDRPHAESDESTRATSAIEWGVSRVNADTVWAMGFTGQGVVVGGQDTGYQWDHPAVINQYRGHGTQGTAHDYNWHDSIHTGGGVCGADSLFPCDDTNHGTHTLGTMVGDDGGSNQIGVAPGARWIGCRNMDRGNGTPQSYTECFQWFVAPTDLEGNNPDPAMAPHVINNSWVCPASEGCSQETLKTIVENTRAAGILVVASAGNAGSSCSTVNNAPAHYQSTFSVGATSSSDVIASFSSRGPVIADGSNRRKPDLSAPGVNVRSSIPGDGYANFSGTSMAAPHVVGVTALLLSARPDLIGRVAEIEGILRASTLRLTTTDGCGGDSVSQIPNNTYGYGRIDATTTIQGDADADLVDNLNDCAPIAASLWAVPSPAWQLTLSSDASGTMTWQRPLEPGAQTVYYDVLRSESARDFSGAFCVAGGRKATASADSAVPTSIFYYLIRAGNGCGDSLSQRLSVVPGPDCFPE